MRTLSGKNCGSSVSGVASIAGLATLALVVVVASAAVVRASDAARDLVAVTVPSAPARLDWDDERRLFAARLQRGYGLDQAAAMEFSGWILEASVRQDLAPELLASVLMTESGFRKEARSVTGAVGPAQVNPRLWGQFCGGNLDDPEQNVYCGAHILGHYRDNCAASRPDEPTLAEECALRAYNVGYRNRNNVYYLAATVRYLDKIDRFRAPLRQS